jgi:hypothetical protein
MQGANRGCFNKDEEANTPKEQRHTTTPTTIIETTLVALMTIILI